jgi:hypothetical protein
MNTTTMNATNCLSPKAVRIHNAVKTNWQHLTGMHLYTITINVALSHDIAITATMLSGLLRTLINSGQAIDRHSNRDWFNQKSWGGFYLKTISQSSPSTVPVVSYNIVCIGHEAHPVDGLTKDLNERVKKIIPTAEVEITQMDKLNDVHQFASILSKVSGEPSIIYLESEPFQKLNKHLQRWLISALGKDVRCFGNLYFITHLPRRNRNYGFTLSGYTSKHVAGSQ